MMAKKPFNIYDAILILSICAVAILVLVSVSYSNNHIAEPQFITCGTCGAHVIEWWHVRNNSDTAFIEVCSKCYDRLT